MKSSKSILIILIALVAVALPVQLAAQHTRCAASRPEALMKRLLVLPSLLTAWASGSHALRRSWGQPEA